MKIILFDIVIFGGASGVLYGLYQAWPPLAWIVGGVGAISGTLFVWIRQEREKRREGREL